jgi:hypothetical protein
MEPMISRPDSPVESRGITELSRLVDGLTRAVLSAREKLSPMSQQMRPMRERIAELRDEAESKKQVRSREKKSLQVLPAHQMSFFALCHCLSFSLSPSIASSHTKKMQFLYEGGKIPYCNSGVNIVSEVPYLYRIRYVSNIFPFILWSSEFTV